MLICTRSCIPKTPGGSDFPPLLLIQVQLPSALFEILLIYMPDCRKSACILLKKVIKYRCLIFVPCIRMRFCRVCSAFCGFFLQSHSTSYTADSARRCNEMGKFCEVCGKGAMSGNLVSHSNRKTRRIWAPNVQRVNVIVNGTPKKMNVCTRCLRSGKVQRNV